MADEKMSQDISENKVMAALSYAWILCLVPLLGKRNSKFAQFHAKQGLVLFIIELIVALIPFFGWMVLLVLVVISVMGIIKALDGEWWKIPFIYDWSKKINL